jgi:hypothetical protein
MAESNQESSQLAMPKLSGAILPAVTLDAVKPLLGTLMEIGLSLSRDRLAAGMNTTITSSGFIQKVAAARYYGFVEYIQPGNRIELTERGRAFVQGDQAAAQDAFMDTTFGEIAKGLLGLRLSRSVVEVHFVERAGLGKAPAQRMALTFMQAASQAGFLENDRLKPEMFETVQPPDQHLAMPTIPSSSAWLPKGFAPVSGQKTKLATGIAYGAVPTITRRLPSSWISSGRPRPTMGQPDGTHRIPVAAGMTLTYEGDMIELMSRPEIVKALQSLRQAAQELQSTNDDKTV